MRTGQGIARLLAAAVAAGLVLAASGSYEPAAAQDDELSASIPLRVTVGETVELTGSVASHCEPGTAEVGFWMAEPPPMSGDDFRNGSEVVLLRPTVAPGSTFTAEVVVPDLGVQQAWFYRICRGPVSWVYGMTLITFESTEGVPDTAGSGGGDGSPVSGSEGGTTAPASNSALFSQGRSNVVSAVPAADETPWDLMSLLVSSLLAALLVLLIVFPSELFNSTLDEHYDEIKAALRRWGQWLPVHRMHAPETSAAPRRGWVGFLAITAASAVLYGLLDPGFGPNLASGVLVIGVAAGVAVSTLISAGTTGWLARRRFGQADYWFRVLPGALLVGALCVAISRMVGFLPGYLYGLIGGLAFRQDLGDDDQARTVVLSSVAVLAAALVGWLSYGPVAERVTADASLPWVVGESVLAGTFIAGVQGLLFSLLPLRYLPGEKLYRWSRWMWAGLYGMAAFAFIHLIARPAAAEGPAAVSWAKILTLFIGFGGASVAFWGYWRQRDIRREVLPGDTEPEHPLAPELP